MGHGLKYKNKTINLLEKNPGEYLPDLGLRKIFGLDIIPLSIIGKVYTLYLIKILNFCSVKEPVQKEDKLQPVEKSNLTKALGLES